MKMAWFAKKKNISILVSFVMVAAFVFYYFGIYASTSTIVLQPNYISYDDVNELDKSSDLIIVASPNKDFENREHHGTYFKDGTLADFYTISEVKIHKVLKEANGIKAGENINVLEPASIIQTAWGKHEFQFEDYMPLETSKKYILFLKKNENGQYCIINMNLGKLDLSFKEKALSTTDETEKFMKEAFEKYETD